MSSFVSVWGEGSCFSILITFSDISFQAFVGRVGFVAAKEGEGCCAFHVDGFHRAFVRVHVGYHLFGLGKAKKYEELGRVRMLHM